MICFVPHEKKRHGVGAKLSWDKNKNGDLNHANRKISRPELSK